MSLDLIFCYTTQGNFVLENSFAFILNVSFFFFLSLTKVSHPKLQKCTLDDSCLLVPPYSGMFRKALEYSRMLQKLLECSCPCKRKKKLKTCKISKKKKRKHLSVLNQCFIINDGSSKIYLTKISMLHENK